MLNLNHVQSKYEPHLFFKRFKDNSISTHYALHVDEFLLFSNNDVERQKLREDLAATFTINNLALAKYCLGLELEQSDNTVKIPQDFILTCLDQYQMSDAKAVSVLYCPDLTAGAPWRVTNERA